MRLVLNIATILGGIASLWFFWDKFKTFKIGRNKTSYDYDKEHFASLKGPFWQIIVMFLITAVCCGIAGIAAGLAVIKLGFIGALATIIISIICLYLGAELETQEREPVGFPIALGGGCMLWWSVIGMIVSVSLSLYTGVPFNSTSRSVIFIVLGGIVGIVFGFAVAYGAYSQARNSV
jgi:predicted metal-binding membrane protein